MCFLPHNHAFLHKASMCWAVNLFRVGVSWNVWLMTLYMKLFYRASPAYFPSSLEKKKLFDVNKLTVLTFYELRIIKNYQWTPPKFIWLLMSENRQWNKRRKEKNKWITNIFFRMRSAEVLNRENIHKCFVYVWKCVHGFLGDLIYLRLAREGIFFKFNFVLRNFGWFATKEINILKNVLISKKFLNIKTQSSRKNLIFSWKALWRQIGCKMKS